MFTSQKCDSSKNQKQRGERGSIASPEEKKEAIRCLNRRFGAALNRVDAWHWKERSYAINPGTREKRASGKSNKSHIWGKGVSHPRGVSKEFRRKRRVMQTARQDDQWWKNWRSCQGARRRCRLAGWRKKEPQRCHWYLRARQLHSKGEKGKIVNHPQGGRG